MFDKYIAMGKRRMLIKKLIWAQMLGLTGGSNLPWTTFSGNPLQFNAPKAHTLKSATVEFSPKQSGTGDPSPDNVRPISGWTGVDIYHTGANVWDEEWRNGYYTNTGTFNPNANYVANKNPIPILPNTTYYIYIASVPTAGRDILYYDGEMNYLSKASLYANATFTTPANAEYANFNLGSSYGNTYNDDISINYPSTDTEYHAYTGHTYSVTWQDEAGTVYGGTYNFVTGVLTVTMVAFTFASETWTLYSGGSSFFYRILLPAYTAKDGDYTTENGYYIHIFNNTGQARIYLSSYNPTLSADSNMTELLNGYKLCYELATPVTYQLDPQTITALKGINTMWTDGSNLTAEARAETVNLSALQSLNMLLGGRYVNNHTADDLTDEEALDILLGGNER